MSRTNDHRTCSMEASKKGWGRARLLSAATLALLTSVGIPLAQASDGFVKPTAEELSMKSVPGYPGAPAEVLFKEELTKDDNHSVEHYLRIKILSEEGKKYANVELPFVSVTNASAGFADNKELDSVSGRTFHADGTVIPFTGKPYVKTLVKADGVKLQQMVFTLPDVEVGSIIEYRYFTRIADSTVEAPTWLVQGDLYVKQAHFVWWPTATPLLDEDSTAISTIQWFPILPQGAQVISTEFAGGGQHGIPPRVYELSVHDVPPLADEEFMPPIASFSYRVRFVYTRYRSPQEFWTDKGKRWSKGVNSFISVNDQVKQETEKAIAGATTPDDKLKKIYAQVMTIENTHYTRERDQREDKADGTHKINNVSDVLNAGRGTPGQLTDLFIAMARAAGFKAYAMFVPDRSREIFTPSYMSFDQFDTLVAIVNVDGTDRFFDPGSRYCPYGQLAWEHTLVQGLRQTEGGAAFAVTPGDAFKTNHTTRVANLTMGADGQVSGTVKLTFAGAPALHWRQEALEEDKQGLEKQLRESARKMLPNGLEVEVSGIQELQDYEKPLLVNYKVTGTLGTAAGKRVLFPGDVFLARETALFPHEKRENAVYFHYPQYTQDAVRVNFSPDLAVEAVPASASYKLRDMGAYGINIAANPNNVTTRRDFAFVDVIVQPKDYGDLRSFYSQLQSKDQESVVLKANASASAKTGGGAGN